MQSAGRGDLQATLYLMNQPGARTDAVDFAQKTPVDYAMANAFEQVSHRTMHRARSGQLIITEKKNRLRAC